MSGVKDLVVILCLAYAVKAQTYSYDFDCRTAGPDACGTGNTCETSDGTCTCAGTETNYNCKTASTDSSGCATPCIDASTTACEGDVCICEEGYFLGSTSDCSEKRAQITCGTNGADIELNTYAGADFGGIAYMLNNAGDVKVPTCALTCTAGKCVSTPTLLYAGGTGSLHDDCPEIPIDNTDTDGVVTRIFKIYVQYSASSTGTLDRVFTVTCKAGGSTFEATVIAGTSSSVAATAVGTVTGDVDHGVTITLTKGSDAIVTGTAISSGEELTLTVSFAEGLIAATGGTHTDASLKEVIGYNYDVENIVSTTLTAALELALVQNWCVTNDGRQFVTLFMKTDPYPSSGTFDLVVKFKAFTFAKTSDGTALTAASGDSSPVWLKVVICTGDCASSQTGGGCPYGNTYPNMLTTPSTGRKRRQVTESGPSETVDLLLNFTVGTPSQFSTRASPDTVSDQEECYTTLAFILPLVMMAVLLLLALIMVYVFFTKLSHARNGGVHGETNMAYKS